MAYAILYDTGFATAGISGNVASSSNRAGVNTAEDSTSAFPLKIQTETMHGGGALQTDTEIRNTDQLSNVSPVTFSNPKFVLNCSIPVESIDNTDFKHGWLYQLIRFERTKGVKILAFISNNTESVIDYVYNRQPTLPELYGMRYLEEPTKPIVSLLTGQTEGTTPHLVGYVKSISNVTYSSKDNLLRFALTFIVIEDLN